MPVISMFYGIIVRMFHFDTARHKAHTSTEVIMAPQINKVQVEPDHKIFVSFRNGDTRIFDVKPYLDKGVFKELQNPAYFKKVTIVPGGIAWPNSQDLSADTIYLRGTRRTRPSFRSIKKS